MDVSRQIGFWLILTAVGFFLTPLLRSSESMESFLRHEIGQTQAAVGPRVSGWADTFAQELFAGTPLSVIADGAASAMHNERDRALMTQIGGPGGRAASKYFNSYMQGLSLQAYIVARRLVIVLVWAVILAPLLLAAVYDGLMRRQVKRAEFGMTRPATFSLAGLVVVPLCALPIVYLVLPITIPPLAAPVWAALVAVPLSVLVANSQPLSDT